MPFDALIASTSLVTVAEIGDKTQLLSLMLAARYRKAVPIILGILVATTLNHALAAWAGHWLGGSIDSEIMQRTLSLAFIAIGLWVLIPDKIEAMEEGGRDLGAFTTSLIAFFLAEMGDKTQLATVTLGAEYESLLQVVVGTTLGMLIANIPAVLVGEKLLKVIPLKVVRYIAATLFIGFGVVGFLKTSQL